MPGEFELIKTYFSGLQQLASGVVLGIGDDAALLQVPADHQLVVATDTLVADVHFPADMAPEYIAARSLLVNLSDLAAMGAEPRWFSLALTLPQADSDWLAAFSRGLAETATTHQCALIGGDTTRGSLTITITVHGVVPTGKALTRSAAQPGDHIVVTGEPGLGTAGLQAVLGKLALTSVSGQQKLLDKFQSPFPRLIFGKQLRGLASSAIDISDGLLADLGHICQRSEVGAELELSALPSLGWLGEQVTAEQRQQWALTGGDDYELCFTVSDTELAAVRKLAQQSDTSITVVGRIVEGSGVTLFDPVGVDVSAHYLKKSGYQHF